MIINSDFDGVLIPADFEKKFFNVDKSWRVSIDEYVRMVHEAPTPVINTSLLSFYNSLKEEGHVIRLLTNRNYEMEKCTRKVLGNYVSIFDSMIFCGGMKKTRIVEGLVIDNEEKYLSCGSQGGILYQWNPKERR
jgi:hypothetical protein